MKTLYLHVYQDSASSAVFKLYLLDTEGAKNLEYWSVNNGEYHNRYLPESFRQYGYEMEEDSRSSKPVILGLKLRSNL